MKNFEIHPIDDRVLQFKCTFGVWPVNSDSSVCYCTSEERAEFIAEALNQYDKEDLRKMLQGRE